MIFKDLLKEVSIEDIMEYFKKVHPDEVSYREDYELLYNKLLEKEPIFDSKLKLVVIEQRSYFEEESESDTSLEVLGFDFDAKCGFAIEFLEWSSWLGLEVVDKCVEVYGKIPFVSECLLELSFISFDEEVVQDNLDSLVETGEKVKSGEMKTIPAEEVFKELLGEDYESFRMTEEEKEAESKKIQEIMNWNSKKFLEIVGVEPCLAMGSPIA